MNNYPVLSLMLLATILVFSALFAAPFSYATIHSLTITKSVNPTNIQLAGMGTPDTTEVTITVPGYGGTTAETLPIDVVYGIDSSGSMGWNDPSNLRLEAAKNFTDKLDPTRDQAGVVSWDTDIDFTYGLTNDFVTLKTQIDAVDSAGGTDLDVGLNAAIAMLDANTRVGDSVEVIIFLSNGQGTYTFAGDPGSPADDADSKGYVIYSIGLGPDPYVDALQDMASATGGQYYSSPTAENLQAIFDAIFTQIITSTAPSNVDVVEVTQPYIIDEGSFSIPPDSVVEVSGKTVITWLDVARYVGNGDSRLAADETFSVTFRARSSECGTSLPVDVEGEAVVNYLNPDGDPLSQNIPQAYINVSCAPPSRPVGGEIVPMNIVAVMAPWVAFGLAVLALGSAALLRRKLLLH